MIKMSLALLLGAGIKLGKCSRLTGHLRICVREQLSMPQWWSKIGWNVTVYCCKLYIWALYFKRPRLCYFCGYWISVEF